VAGLMGQTAPWGRGDVLAGCIMGWGPGMKS
jgi:hypothetical protein